MDLNPRIPAGPIAEKWDQHRFQMKLVNPANKRRFDILVVGSGLAGASAAATVGRRRARVSTKSSFFIKNPPESG